MDQAKEAVATALDEITDGILGCVWSEAVVRMRTGPPKGMAPHQRPKAISDLKEWLRSNGFPTTPPGVLPELLMRLETPGKAHRSSIIIWFNQHSTSTSTHSQIIEHTH